jgi:hypothetical protein
MIENLIETLPEARRPALRRELVLLDPTLEQFHLLPEDLALARVPDPQGLGGAARVDGRRQLAAAEPSSIRASITAGGAGPRLGIGSAARRFPPGSAHTHDLAVRIDEDLDDLALLHRLCRVAPNVALQVGDFGIPVEG